MTEDALAFRCGRTVLNPNAVLGQLQIIFDDHFTESL